MKLGVLSVALSCLKTPKFMIYYSANRLRYSRFAIFINYSHCVFKPKRRLYPVHFFMWTFCVQKRKSLKRIDWKF